LHFGALGAAGLAGAGGGLATGLQAGWAVTVDQAPFRAGTAGVVTKPQGLSTAGVGTGQAGGVRAGTEGEASIGISSWIVGIETTGVVHGGGREGALDAGCTEAA
jgi:hypothetical protein